MRSALLSPKIAADVGLWGLNLAGHRSRQRGSPPDTRMREASAFG